MGTIRKRGNKYEAGVCKGGERDSGSFDTLQEARAWIKVRELELAGDKLPDHSLTEGLKDYARKVAPTHKGERWEILRCKLLERYPIARKRMASITSADVAEWRDLRLKEVSGASVAREMNLLRSVFEIALHEWKWIRVNPMIGVKRPRTPTGRKRRISDDEIECISLALGYQGGNAETINDRVAIAFQFAIETAMRSGEILGLTHSDVKPNYVKLPDTKNGDAREVPLSSKARELLGYLPKGAKTVFDIPSDKRDSLFRLAPKANHDQEPVLSRLPRRSHLATIQETRHYGTCSNDRAS